MGEVVLYYYVIKYCSKNLGGVSTKIGKNLTNFYVIYAYTDIQGREWGFVTYLYGSQNIWVCLSEPLNRNLPVLNPEPEPDIWASETVHVDIKQYVSETEFGALIVIIALVMMLVACTAVLIKVFWKPNNETGAKR